MRSVILAATPTAQRPALILPADLQPFARLLVLLARHAAIADGLRLLVQADSEAMERRPLSLAPQRDEHRSAVMFERVLDVSKQFTRASIHADRERLAIVNQPSDPTRELATGVAWRDDTGGRAAALRVTIYFPNHCPERSL